MAGPSRPSRRAGRQRRVTSAFSTGGGGFLFETGTGGFVAAAMLAGAQPFGAEIGVPEAIRLQASAHGHALDDLVVYGQELRPTRGRRVLACSAKAFNMMPGGVLLEEFVADAWREMLRDGFREGHDRLGLICGQAGAGNLRALEQLVAAARTDSDAGLAARIATPGAFNVTHRSLWGSARCPAGLAEQHGIDRNRSPARLLRHLIARRFDLEDPHSVDAAQARAWCQAALVPAQAGSAAELLGAVLDRVEEARTTGGSLDFAALAAARPGLLLQARPDTDAAWRPLAEHTQHVVGAVRDTLGAGLQLPRAEAWATLQEAQGRPVTLLTGPSGCGKSALAKRWMAAEEEARGLWLSALDLEAGLDGLRARLGLPVPLVWLLEHLPGRLRAVLDGLDRAFTPITLQAAAELARAAQASAGRIELLVPCQQMALARVVRELAAAGVQPGTPVAIGDLDDADLGILREQPQVLRLAVGGGLRDVLRRPKLLDLVLQAADLGVQGLGELRDETDVAGLWWTHIALAGPHGPTRSALLQALAERQADALRQATPITELGAAAVGSVADLQADGALAPGDEQLAFAHDLFGDWARLKRLQAEGDQVTAYLPGKELLPPWHRAVRLLALDALRRDAAGWERLRDALEAEGHRLLADLFLDAVVFADDAPRLLAALWDRLAADGGALLRRLLTRFLAVATVPDPLGALIFPDEPALQARFAARSRVPLWPLWPAVLEALVAHEEQAIELASAPVARIADLWLRSSSEAWPARAAAAELGLAVGRFVIEERRRGAHFEDNLELELYRAALAAGAVEPERTVELLGVALDVSQEEIEEESRERIFGLPAAMLGGARSRGGGAGRRRPRRGPGLPRAGVRSFDRHDRNRLRTAILDGDALVPLIGADPQRAADLLRAAVLDPLARSRRSLLDDEGSLQITDAPRWMGHLPERGPFLVFLSLAPETALELIIEIVEQATERWGELAEPEERETRFEVLLKGEPVELVGDAGVMHWHRGQGRAPTVLTAMLMALEAVPPAGRRRGRARDA